MTCEEFMELMTAYLDGDLPADKRYGFERHIQSCERCQKEMSTYQNCARIFKRFARDEDPPAALRKAVFDRCGCKDVSECCPPSKHEE
jgi:anti-sigma factor (TIGR02949 family)